MSYPTSMWELFDGVFLIDWYRTEAEAIAERDGIIRANPEKAASLRIGHVTETESLVERPRPTIVGTPLEEMTVGQHLENQAKTIEMLAGRIKALEMVVEEHYHRFWETSNSTPREYRTSVPVPQETVVAKDLSAQEPR